MDKMKKVKKIKMAKNLTLPHWDSNPRFLNKTFQPKIWILREIQDKYFQLFFWPQKVLFQAKVEILSAGTTMYRKSYFLKISFVLQNTKKITSKG